MVTKLAGIVSILTSSLILAKIHMVTKHIIGKTTRDSSLILAKIHMVTKLGCPSLPF